MANNRKKKMKQETIEIEGYIIVIFFHEEESQLLIEAKSKGEPLIGTYSVTKHQPHTQPGDYHLHVHNGNNQIFAINQNGSAHDGYHGVKIPNKVYKALVIKYNDWTFPPSKIIETVNYTYILKPTADLNFKEIIAEINSISKDKQLIEQLQNIRKDYQILTENYEIIDLDAQINKFTERIAELYAESIKRLN